MQHTHIHELDSRGHQWTYKTPPQWSPFLFLGICEWRRRMFWKWQGSSQFHRKAYSELMFVAFNMQTEQYIFACTEATKFRNTHSCKKFSDQLPFLDDICNAKNKSIVNRDQFPVFTWSKLFTKGFNKQKMCADKRTVQKNEKILELDALMGLTWLSQHPAPYR